MRYLKLLENFDSSEYFREIPFSEYEHGNTNFLPFCSGRRVPISKKIRSNLESLYDEDWSEEIPNMYQNFSQYLFIRSKLKKPSYTIRLGQDEWWYVDEDNSLLYLKDKPKHTYYECDQFEGLLVLLRSKGIIVK